MTYYNISMVCGVIMCSMSSSYMAIIIEQLILKTNLPYVLVVSCVPS